LDLNNHPWLKELLIPLDGLHNIKGHLHSIVDALLSMKEFDGDLFRSLLDKHIQRREVGNLDGAHFRELFVRWREVIMPAMHQFTPEEQALFSKFFSTWGEVRTAFYTYVLLCWFLLKILDSMGCPLA
jgi:hypothetical protein